MTNDLKTYDLVVMGGGPAGVTAATVASSFGKSVALVDSHQEIGGAGINTGTVPSKTLRETALALSGLKSRNLYGVDLSLRREVTVADFLGHEEHVKDAFHASITQTIYCGTSTFLDAHTIQVNLGSEDREKDPSAPGGEIQLRCEKILIATGSTPVHPNVFPFGHGEIYDSDTILKLDRIPKTLAVVGAGVIGAEYGVHLPRAWRRGPHPRRTQCPPSFFGCGSFPGTGGCDATQRDRLSLERKCAEMHSDGIRWRSARTLLRCGTDRRCGAGRGRKTKQYG